VGFGEVASVELLPGGAATKVTTSNRQQYVSLYCCHLLETSIQRQFGAFKRGFHRLCSGAALKMFRWVCGGCVADTQHATPLLRVGGQGKKEPLLLLLVCLLLTLSWCWPRATVGASLCGRKVL
jgi:hypothetical protein